MSGSRPRWCAGCCTTTSTGTAATRELTQIIDTTDLWFIPVVNVDGYDYTFTEGNRLWRKNLRDNDGDGQITGAGRRRPQPQLPLQVGLRQRGLLDRRRSARPTAARRRGPSPRRRPRSGCSTASGPSTRSTGTRPPSCCCYGVGWQALTSSPDDLIHQAIVGDTDHARGAQLRPAARRPALHHQRRDRRAHGEQLRHADRDAGDVHLRDRVGRRPGRRVGAGGLRQRLRVPRRRDADPAGGREQLPLRDRRRQVGAGPGRPGLAGRPHRARLRPGRVRRLLRPTARRSAAVIRRSLRGKLMHYRINGGTVQTDGRPRVGGR